MPETSCLNCRCKVAMNFKSSASLRFSERRAKSGFELSRAEAGSQGSHWTEFIAEKWPISMPETSCLNCTAKVQHFHCGLRIFGQLFFIFFNIFFLIVHVCAGVMYFVKNFPFPRTRRSHQVIKSLVIKEEWVRRKFNIYIIYILLYYYISIIYFFSSVGRVLND